MEVFTAFLPLIVITVIIVLIVRWRKSVHYLKHSGPDHLKAHGLAPPKVKTYSKKTSEHATTGDWVAMSLYKEKVVGVTMKNGDGSSRQKIISKMREGDQVQIVRDPGNPHGPIAIEVLNKSMDQIGFIDKFRAEELAPQMDKGYRVEGWVDKILTSDQGPNLGVLIAIQRYKPPRAPKHESSPKVPKQRPLVKPIDQSARHAVLEITKLLEMREPLPEDERMRLWNRHMEKVVDTMLDRGITQVEATGAPGTALGASYSGSFEDYIRLIKDDLAEQARIVCEGVEHFFKNGQFPAPHYAKRIAIILRQAKEYDLEAQFLEAFSKHFRSGNGVTYGELAKRAVKARELASRKIG